MTGNAPSAGQGDDPDDPGTGPKPNAGGAVSLGLEMAVPIGLFGFLGYRLDRWLDTEPGWMIGGCLLGMAMAFYQLYKRIQQMKPDATDLTWTEPDASDRAATGDSEGRSENDSQPPADGEKP